MNEFNIFEELVLKSQNTTFNDVVTITFKNENSEDELESRIRCGWKVIDNKNMGSEIETTYNNVMGSIREDFETNDGWITVVDNIHDSKTGQIGAFRLKNKNHYYVQKYTLTKQIQEKYYSVLILEDLKIEYNKKYHCWFILKKLSEGNKLVVGYKFFSIEDAITYIQNCGIFNKICDMFYHNLWLKYINNEDFNNILVPYMGDIKLDHYEQEKFINSYNRINSRELDLNYSIFY